VADIPKLDVVQSGITVTFDANQFTLGLFAEFVSKNKRGKKDVI
jgi:hypothetical protein